MGILAAYCGALKWLIQTVDGPHHRVYLTLPYEAIAAGQFWLIVPTSR